jgi:type IV secretory pathway VirJ component
MKRWLPVLGLFYVLIFSSCSVLKRNRFAKHQGAVANDFDLPVVFYPADNPGSRRLLLLLSGDGGWLEFNDQLAVDLAKKGFNVIGFNSRSYFWQQRLPEETAADVVRLINHYTQALKTNRLYLSGYSFGADVVPFIYNRLPTVTKKKVVGITLLSPFTSTDFMVRTADLLNLSGDDKKYKVADELQKIRIPVYCFYGDKENPKSLSMFKKRNFHLRKVPGDHHYEPAANDKIIGSFRLLPQIKL